MTLNTLAILTIRVFKYHLETPKTISYLGYLKSHIFTSSRLPASQSAVKDKKPRMDAQGKNLIQELSKFCSNRFEDLVSLPPSGVFIDDSVAARAREERGRFKLWGDGFSVLEGDLDDLLLKHIVDRGLWDSVVILLCTQARALVSVLRIHQAELTSPTEFTSGVLSILKTLLNIAARSILDHNLLSGDSLGGGMCSGLLNDDRDFDDIKDYNDSLLDLAIYIEPLWSTSEGIRKRDLDIKSRARIMRMLRGNTNRDLAGYRSLALRLYPRIDKQFLDNLVETHKLRIIRLRKKIDYSSETSTSDQYGIQDIEKLEENIWHQIQPYSCLDNSCPERTITFSNSTDWIEHESKHPSIPRWVCVGNCGETFHNKEDFLAHVLGTHLAGSAEPIGKALDAIANSRKFLILSPHPLKMQCPFCKEEVEETAHIPEKHIGKHMKGLLDEMFKSLKAIHLPPAPRRMESRFSFDGRFSPKNQSRQTMKRKLGEDIE